MNPFIELAEEFESDAELLERVAEVYKAKDLNLQYEVLWHEAVTYRCCADRLRSAVEEEKGYGQEVTSPGQKEP